MLYHRKEHNASNKAMTTTDTPRTDAVVSEPCAIHQVMQKWEKIIENSRQLERELAEAKDDLESVRPALAAYRKTCDCLDEVGNRAKKAEAEVERLKETLEFIAADDSGHDSTAYYRAIANQTLRLLIK
jgi:myosin heavy subunit